MRKFVVLVVALVVGGAVTVAVTASQAGASSEFTLGSHLTNLEFITAQAGPSTSFPASPMVPGDRLVARDDLTQNGSPVGYLESICTDTFNSEFLCDSTYALKNRGDLHASFLARGNPHFSFSFPAVYDLIVDGGTFAFHNAHGSAHVVANGADATITFAIG
jgi:hypothetical protein